MKIETPEGCELDAEIEVTIYQSGQVYIEMHAKQTLRIESMELASGELKVVISPDWCR